MSIRAKKITASVVFIVLGLVLCAYGLTLHTTTVTGEKADAPAVAMSEPELVRKASVGGVRLDKQSGKIKQTYTGKSPEACAT